MDCCCVEGLIPLDNTEGMGEIGAWTGASVLPVIVEVVSLELLAKGMISSSNMTFIEIIIFPFRSRHL